LLRGFEAARASLAAYLPLIRARNALDLREGAHEVAAEYLQNVALAVAATQKLVGDVWQVFDAAYALGERDAAVEVRAEPYVINASDLRDVVYVVNEHADGRGRQRVRVVQLLQLFAEALRVVLELRVESVALRLQPFVALYGSLPNLLVEEDRVEVDHHDAALSAYALQEVVGDVALVVREDARRRVRGHDRRFGHVERVRHRLVRDVRDVHEHSQA